MQVLTNQESGLPPVIGPAADPFAIFRSGRSSYLWLHDRQRLCDIPESAAGILPLVKRKITKGNLSYLYYLQVEGLAVRVVAGLGLRPPTCMKNDRKL